MSRENTDAWALRQREAAANISRGQAGTRKKGAMLVPRRFAGHPPSFIWAYALPAEMFPPCFFKIVLENPHFKVWEGSVLMGLKMDIAFRHSGDDAGNCLFR